jgi:hypothetical protein
MWQQWSDRLSLETLHPSLHAFVIHGPETAYTFESKSSASDYTSYPARYITAHSLTCWCTLPLIFTHPLIHFESLSLLFCLISSAGTDRLQIYSFS